MMILFWLRAVVEAVAWFGFSDWVEGAAYLVFVEVFAPFLEPGLALSEGSGAAWEVPE
jgi:hypothetical protein